MNGLVIKEFTVEYRTGGIGLDVEAPVFSWKLVSGRQNTVQNSYRLRVSGGGLLYDTGTVESGQSVCVPYAGGKLVPQTEYRAEAEATDNHGDRAFASLTFETGLMAENFTAEFISADCENAPACFEVFKTFTVKKKVLKARAYATALGMYMLAFNGKRAGGLYFTPYWTSYDKMLEYQTYDVTGLLKEGENEAAVTVSKGWYSGDLGFMGEQRGHYGTVNAALTEIHIFYGDGSKETVKTDSGWKARRSYIADSEIYHGETQDFTQETSEIFSVKAVSYDKNNLVAQINEPCRVTERIKPVKHIVTPNGEQVLDFGQNLVGVVEFKIAGVKGQTVVLKYAEILDQNGNFYTVNLRRAKCTDTFILNGGEQILSPVFTFHGFRYLQIIGADVVPGDYTALVIHSDMTPAGTLETSSPLINRLISNIRWGQRGNFVDVPTDCPQRDERMGWTGDLNVFARTATFNYNVAPFLRKWLKDMPHAQYSDGFIPLVVPDVLKTRLPGNGEAMWGSAAVMVPWTLYQVYGDVRFVSDQYDCMRKYVDKLLSIRGGNGLIDAGHQYADWLSLDGSWNGNPIRGGTDHYYIANVFCAVVTGIFAAAAGITGHAGDQKKYSAVYDEVLEAIRREYFTATGRMVTETQTACALALYFDIAPPALRPRIVKLLGEVMERREGKLLTGFIGTPFLCFALSDNGLHRYAEALLRNEKYPGWLYSVRMGATTVWERWDSLLEGGRPNPGGMNSYNHYAYGSVGEYLWRRVAGIDNLEPGYKKIRIAPRVVQGIDRVYGAYESVYGTIASGYELSGGKIMITVKIPVNTTAEIVLPDGETFVVGSGDYVYECDNDHAGRSGDVTYIQNE